MGFKPREWTPMQDTLVRKLWDEGLFVRDIAWRLSIPRSSLTERIRALQLPIRPVVRIAGSWSPEKDKHLSALWAEGLSTLEIGRRMGISKNAVVGRTHRLKLPARPSPIRRDRTSAPRCRPPVPKLQQLESLRMPMLVHPAPAMPVRRGSSMPCVFPFGEPRTPSFRFCEAPSAAGRPYCAEHVALCYVRVRTWEDAA